MSTDQLYDCIVVGAGGSHGSATLYHLAKRGFKVLGLESQATAPHAFGSHHGDTRITRLAYFEDPQYVALLRRTFELWDDLEMETGDQCFLRTGMMNVTVDPAGYPGRDCFAGALASTKEHGLEHRMLSVDEAQRRVPAATFPAGSRVLLEPNGGVLFPHVVIASHLAVAKRHGARLECGVRVATWSVGRAPNAATSPGLGGGDEIVEVTLADGRSFRSRKLVLVPGAWLSSLVPELATVARPERNVIAWFDIDAASKPRFGPDRLPVAIVDDEVGTFYSFPADANGFKIGMMHHRREGTDPDAIDREIYPEDISLLRHAVSRYFPAANNAIVKAAACLFTNTPDLHFLIDRHPRHGGSVVFASACSGHGFKFASVMGEILADLATEGSTRFNIDLFRLRRDRAGFEGAIAAFDAAPAAPRL